MSKNYSKFYLHEINIMSNKTLKNDQITKQKDEKRNVIKKKIEDDVLTR